ncbi:polysaccharide deacetylase family protein [Streptacidiphilus fuscans]|uniref:Polysaccharide deacetylase family protein n=1 Tax=Streptacidiphilus fuscans TaxID=2789292 RepID=A0A931AW29_9ACTN|nr:polysaccharide deacetylase family protein [Streptacidiphilus fuscans]MBF9066539.1 polysaccharide deacetylase family protein [Streptacidiphilus fuscans]
MSAVPILLYHSVSDNPPDWIAPFTVRPRVFAEQLDDLVRAEVTVVPLRRLLAAIRGGPPLPARAAVLTFDDGFADFYWTVAPMLAERELPATLFVTTGAIHPPGGRPNGSVLPPADMLNWRQVAGLDAYGVEIGGHSRTHPHLDTLTNQHLSDEVVLCKHELEDALGHSVANYAYPHGYNSAAVRRKVQRAGWDSACAVVNAFSSTADDTLRLARLTVRADTPRSVFRCWLRGEGAPDAPTRDSLSTRGWRLYRRARARFTDQPPGRPDD